MLIIHHPAPASPLLLQTHVYSLFFNVLTGRTHPQTRSGHDKAGMGHE
jgi:hypothetical protein